MVIEFLGNFVNKEESNPLLGGARGGFQ